MAVFVGGAATAPSKEPKTEGETMSVFFTRRGKAAQAGPVLVTITGTGSSTNAYTTINGNVYTSAASGVEVIQGDVISFYIKGSGGSVTIDGETVATGGMFAKTYDWTVPEGIQEVVIVLTLTGSGSIGSITVTTS